MITSLNLFLINKTHVEHKEITRYVNNNQHNHTITMCRDIIQITQ